MTSPLLAFLRKVDTALDGYVESPVWVLDPAERAEAQQLVARIGDRFDATELTLAHQADLDDRNAKTAWVRSTRQSPRVCAARLKLAAALDAREPLRSAMARGEVCEAQAREVVRALDRLPADQLDPQVREQAQRMMIELCGQHHAEELRVLGRRLLETLAPEIAEAEEARAIDADYRRAMRKRYLELWDRGDGTFGVKGVLPAMHGHILDKLLKAWASPRHIRACGNAEVKNEDASQRRARAFCEFLERLDPHAVPYSGGVSARVVVEMDLDDLTTRMRKAGVATLDGVIDVPAWVARRMACEAGIMPVVLGGKGEVLALGRSRRFHNEPQRLAIHLRDKTCRADGCAPS